ncbi:phosphoglucosamine mutase family protein [Striga asiatica]|uniref:Phosphoglucosamine mutase family protein n=1 Tax=Striga asiatica TaxID=4170 RepID=A0A5A7PTY9_STRAF|nr:phosphoglucosamine mutase family protein [Striga asiatica]
MPGTIQVTVLGFKGVSSSSEPSAKSLKGNPITKLGEDLVVALLDAAGNVITRADIRTMKIIEKGFWDEVFSINRGGHVHMKLQFVLSEEERNRIRAMRESALKKKLEKNPNFNLKHTETISDVLRTKVDGSQASSSSTSPSSSATSQSSYQKEGVSILESAVIPVKELSIEVKSLKKTPSVPSQLNRLLKREDKSLKKAPSVPFRLNRFTTEHLTEAPRESDLAVKTESCREQTVKELDKLPYDLARQTSSRKATTSGRTISTETVNSSGNSGEEGIGRESRRRGTRAKSEGSLECSEEGRYSPCLGFGTWIFPDNTRRLCVTTADNYKIMCSQQNEMNRAECKSGKNEDKVSEPPDGSSNGHIGQVVKIAVILGFGVFVLLTRQKEPRHTYQTA